MAAKQIWYGGFIDPPGRYSPVEEWEQFLAKIEAMEFAPDAIPPKADLIQDARDVIVRIRRPHSECKAEGGK